MKPVQAVAVYKLILSRSASRRSPSAMSKKNVDGHRQRKPLENMKFYLHFKSRRPQTQLVQDLTCLGARVEPFFGRDISCVVTDIRDLNFKLTSTPQKLNSVDSSGPSTSPSCSNGYLSNRRSPGASCASTRRSVDSKSSAHMARGQALVQKAIRNVPGPVDILELCQQWQIEVRGIKGVLRWVQELKQKEKARLGAEKSGKENLKTKQKSDLPQKLVPPFIKIEDEKCMFRPLFRTLKQWPEVNLEQCQEYVPTPVPPLPKEPSVDSHLKGVPLRLDTAKATPRVKITEQKKLNCEICGHTYSCLEEHLKSESHQKFMSNPNNFRAVSSLISSLPCALPSRLAHPLSEINGRDWSTSSASTCESSSEEDSAHIPAKACHPRASPQAVSVEKECPGPVMKSVFSGTFSTIRHIKVVRKETAPAGERPDHTLPRSVSGLRKRPATFSGFETQAIVKRDTKVQMCYSDVCNAEQDCVPPSFSSDPTGVEEGFMAGMSMLKNSSVLTPVKSVEKLLLSPSSFFNKRAMAMCSSSSSSTLQYSWTDVVSGVVPESSMCRRQCDDVADTDSENSCLRFASFASTKEPLKSHKVVDKINTSCVLDENASCMEAGGPDIATSLCF